MLKLILYIMIVTPGFVYFYVLSHAPHRRWWEDMIALWVVILAYSLFIFSFYEDDRIGNITFVVSTALLLLFGYKAFKNIVKKVKSE